MTRISDASPRVSVRLYKTISRETVNGSDPVSARYQGKSDFIDLTPFLGDNSAVTTSKSVRDAAGAFSVTFADRPHQSAVLESATPLSTALESIYGLIEPMDVVEIRMWNGLGAKPVDIPIKMRGFVSQVQRVQSVDSEGRPVRQVIVSGQDYGKIWQTYQVLYMPAYLEGKPLLTSFQFSELFGDSVVNTRPAADLVRSVMDKAINRHIDGFMPEHTPMPRKIETGDTISVSRGVVNQSYQKQQGSIYDILKHYGDVGIWNELFLIDKEDGVHCVYRPTPALHLSVNEDETPRKVQNDAPDPVDVIIDDSSIVSLNLTRSDSNVANFYWVNNSQFDLIDDNYRKLFAVGADNNTVSLRDYPNTAIKYYGVRPMYAESQQGGNDVGNLTTGLDAERQAARGGEFEAWLDDRRRIMVEMNRDNVAFESGTAQIKGGPMRPDGECMKAGDYAVFRTGRVTWRAYVTSITDEYLPFQGYTTTLTLERATNFATRSAMESGIESPWLAEQARRFE